MFELFHDNREAAPVVSLAAQEQGGAPEGSIGRAKRIGKCRRHWLRGEPLHRADALGRTNNEGGAGKTFMSNVGLGCDAPPQPRGRLAEVVLVPHHSCTCAGPCTAIRGFLPMRLKPCACPPTSAGPAVHLQTVQRRRPRLGTSQARAGQCPTGVCAAVHDFSSGRSSSIGEIFFRRCPRRPLALFLSESAAHAATRSRILAHAIAAVMRSRAPPTWPSRGLGPSGRAHMNYMSATIMSSPSQGYKALCDWKGTGVDTGTQRQSHPQDGIRIAHPASPILFRFMTRRLDAASGYSNPCSAQASSSPCLCGRLMTHHARSFLRMCASLDAPHRATCMFGAARAVCRCKHLLSNSPNMFYSFILVLTIHVLTYGRPCVLSCPSSCCARFVAPSISCFNASRLCWI